VSGLPQRAPLIAPFYLITPYASGAVVAQVLPQNIRRHNNTMQAFQWGDLYLS
jgi:hypothetical protein